MAYRWLIQGLSRARLEATRPFLCALGAALGLACQPQIGDECQTSVDCSQGGERLCDITQPGGYCTVFNCEPKSCPEDSACIAFGTQLSPADGCRDANGLSRFTRSFCMATCGSDDDCRSGYTCADVRGAPWNALLVDPSGSGRVCVVSTESREVPSDRSAEVCSVSSGGSAGAASGSGGTAGLDSGTAGSSTAGSGGAMD